MSCKLKGIQMWCIISKSDSLNMGFFFKNNMYNSRLKRIFLFNGANIPNALNWSIIQMVTSLEYTFSCTCSPRSKMEKGFSSPVTTVLDQRLSALCPIAIHRCRLALKHTMKMTFPLQRPLRMAFANINGFAKAKKSNKLHILSHIFLKACLNKVLKGKHCVF